MFTAMCNLFSCRHFTSPVISESNSAARVLQGFVQGQLARHRVSGLHRAQRLNELWDICWGTPVNRKLVSLLNKYWARQWLSAVRQRMVYRSQAQRFKVFWSLWSVVRDPSANRRVGHLRTQWAARRCLANFRLLISADRIAALRQAALSDAGTNAHRSKALKQRKRPNVLRVQLAFGSSQARECLPNSVSRHTPRHVNTPGVLQKAVRRK